MNENLRNLLKQLRLSGLAEALDVRLQIHPPDHWRIDETRVAQALTKGLDPNS
jgi:hypothetical protein